MIDNSILMKKAIGGKKGGIPVIAPDNNGNNKAVIADGTGPTKKAKVTKGKYMGINIEPR
jgi:hypothetical protein